MAPLHPAVTLSVEGGVLHANNVASEVRLQRSVVVPCSLTSAFLPPGCSPNRVFVETRTGGAQEVLRVPCADDAGGSEGA
jgi:hypothetical protein